MGSELLFRRVDGRPWLFRNVMDAAAYVHKPDLQNIVWQFAQDLLQPETQRYPVLENYIDFVGKMKLTSPITSCIVRPHMLPPIRLPTTPSNSTPSPHSHP
jgi:hypothetical protein